MFHSFDPSVWLKELFIKAGLSFTLSSVLSTLALVIIVLSLSWLSNLIVKAIIRQVVTRVVRKTASIWDDIFLEQKVFTRLSHFAPALVIWFLAAWALKAYPVWLIAVQKLTYIYMVIAGMVVVDSFIESWHRIYLTLPISQHRHIKGYVQVVKLIVAIIAILIIVAVVFKTRVSAIVTGLGAMAAVIMLIFKDAILGLAASIQLSANHMLKVGDWITIPSKDVDGIVEDITLTTVKVRNFDKTIMTVPVYSLVSESFQNWKGMQESGVRQIKRYLFLIDMRSIKFPEPGLRRKLCNMELLKGFAGCSDENKTNLGLFRAYAEAYLRNHPLIDKNETVMIRHREPEGNGLPIQIFAYSSDNRWEIYENLQSEIIEHLLAVVGEFDLKVFQQPTGDDLLVMSKTK